MSKIDVVKKSDINWFRNVGASANKTAKSDKNSCFLEVGTWWIEARQKIYFYKTCSTLTFVICLHYIEKNIRKKCNKER